MDQPISDLACIPFFMICEQAVVKCKVMMTGDGGDELFRGYRAFNYEMPAKIFWTLLNLFSRNFRKKILNHLLKISDVKYLSARSLLARLFASSLVSKGNRWAVALSPTFALQGVVDDFSCDHRYSVPQDLESYFQQYILPQIYLQKTDRMSMGQSLESRTPFFSSSFFEYGSGFSKKYLRRNGKPHVDSLVPEIYRAGKARKRGLGVPISKVMNLLIEPKWNLLTKYLDIKIIERAWDSRNLNAGMAQLTWNLYVLNFHLNKWHSFGVKMPEPEKGD